MLDSKLRKSTQRIATSKVQFILFSLQVVKNQQRDNLLKVNQLLFSNIYRPPRPKEL